MHALVPGGGPSLTKDRWINTRHPRQRRKRKPYLINNELLSQRFGELFLAGVQRLRQRRELRVEDAPALDALLATLRTSPWVVYIEAPPHKDASPEQVLKYLARYLTGGPISDRRLLWHEHGEVTFLARDKTKPTGKRRPKQVPVTMHGAEFVRCWALHILPKGYAKVRRYGGYCNRHCQSYLERCGNLLNGSTEESTSLASVVQSNEVAPSERAEPPSPRCRHCRQPMVCLAEKHRASWFEIMTSPVRPAWYNFVQPRAG